MIFAALYRLGHAALTWPRRERARRKRLALRRFETIRFAMIGPPGRRISIPDRSEQYPMFVPIVWSHPPLNEGRPGPELGEASLVAITPRSVTYEMPPAARAAATNGYSPGWRIGDRGFLELSEFAAMGRPPAWAPIPPRSCRLCAGLGVVWTERGTDSVLLDPSPCPNGCP